MRGDSRRRRWLWALAVVAALAVWWLWYPWLPPSAPGFALDGRGFAGDTRPAAARVLGVPAASLELSIRYDYGHGVRVADYAQSERMPDGPGIRPRLAHCGIREDSGAVASIWSSAGRRVLPPMSRHAALMRALRFLGSHEFALTPEAQLTLPKGRTSMGEVYSFSWRYQRQGVLLPDGVMVEVNAYNGRVASFHHQVWPIEVPLEPKITADQALSTAVAELRAREGPSWQFHRQETTLEVRFLSHEKLSLAPCGHRFPWPASETCKVPAYYQKEYLVYTIALWEGPTPQDCEDEAHPNVEVHVDALTGKVVTVDRPWC